MDKDEIDAEINAQNKIIEMLKKEQEKAQKKIEAAKKKLENIKTDTKQASLEAAADDIALTQPKKTQSAGKCEATDAATKKGYNSNTPDNKAKATKYYCSFRTKEDTCNKAANTKLKLGKGEVCNWVITQGGGKKRRKRTLKKRKRKSRRRKKRTRKKRKKR